MPDTAVLQKDLLRISDLHAWYGESHILHGMNFTVSEGEVVTLLGRNGAGKTTTLRAIMGIVGNRRDSISLADEQLIGQASKHIPKAGIPSSSEKTGIFASVNCGYKL